MRLTVSSITAHSANRRQQRKGEGHSPSAAGIFRWYVGCLDPNSLPKVSITLNSDHTQPLVVRVFSWWQEWSANINPIENSVIFARPPSICSIFDMLWQQRITAAFGARPKHCCFGNPNLAAASASSNIHSA